MTWFQTYTGKAFSYTDMRKESIDIQDIAHALSNMCRFYGHTTSFYSVAEHSILVMLRVMDLMEMEVPIPLQDQSTVKKWALLHNAAEAYVGDVVRPLKYMSGMEGYRKLEKVVRCCIADKWNLPHEMHMVIRRADNELLATEKKQLMVTPPRDWDDLPKPLDVKLACLLPHVAKREFLRAANELGL